MVPPAIAETEVLRVAVERLESGFRERGYWYLDLEDPVVFSWDGKPLRALPRERFDQLDKARRSGRRAALFLSVPEWLAVLAALSMVAFGVLGIEQSLVSIKPSDAWLGLVIAITVWAFVRKRKSGARWSYECLYEDLIREHGIEIPLGPRLQEMLSERDAHRKQLDRERKWEGRRELIASMTAKLICIPISLPLKIFHLEILELLVRALEKVIEDFMKEVVLPK